MNRRTVDTRLSSAPTHLIKREPGNEAMIRSEVVGVAKVANN